MKFIFASGNNGKIEQARTLIKANGFNIELIPQKEIGFDENVIEDGETFEENSKIKATALKNYCDKNGIEYDLVLADDSGLCVDILNGKPGVYSARWAGEGASNDVILAHLLNELKEYQDMNDRGAEFATVFTGILPDGEVVVAKGICRGKILKEYKKLHRLTYNPVFMPDGFDKPIGEMNEEELSKVHNHREHALRELVKKLKEMNKYF